MDNEEKKTTLSPKPVRQTPDWMIGLLRWGITIFVAFLVGALLVTLVFHLPLRQNYQRASTELETAQEDVADLSGQVDELTTELSNLKTTNEDLQTNLDHSSLQQAITKALAEVRATRVAIVTDDLAGARLGITQTIQSLQTIKGLIDKENDDIVSDMLNKAEQADTNIKTRLASAQPALEQLDTTLLKLFDTLFPPER